jgi:hypothetical protein
MKLRTKRNGIVLAIAGTVVALLLEPINGPRRRARIRSVLEPVGRPLLAMRRRVTGRNGEAEAPESGSLADRLQHVAVRAQGQIDMPVEPDGSSGPDIAPGLKFQQGSTSPLADDTAAAAGVDGKRRWWRKKAGSEE